MKTEKNTNKSKLNEIKSNLKYFKQLESQSKVEPIPARTGPKNTKRTFLNDDKKFQKLWPQKERQYSKARRELINKKRVKSDPKLRFETYDIWDEKEDSDQNDSDLKELIDYQLILKGTKPPKTPKLRYQKPSLLPAIEVPHSGASYNPSFDDHQKLLSLAHDIEVQKLKEENHLKRVVEDNYVTKAEAPNDKTWVQEMSHGLGLSDEEDIDHNIDDNEEVLHYSKQIRPQNKKTKAQRRKEQLEKQRKADKKAEKSLKSKANEIFKLRKFKKEIEENEKKSIEKQKRRSQRIIEKLYQPNKLSHYKYEAPDIELNLSEELSGSLRTIKTDGNLLEDRFKSLQRRNLIESRTKQLFKRKYKLKEIAKKSCKQNV